MVMLGELVVRPRTARPPSGARRRGTSARCAGRARSARTPGPPAPSVECASARKFSRTRSTRSSSNSRSTMRIVGFALRASSATLRFARSSSVAQTMAARRLDVDALERQPGCATSSISTGTFLSRSDGDEGRVLALLDHHHLVPQREQLRRSPGSRPGRRRRRRRACAALGDHLDPLLVGLVLGEEQVREPHHRHPPPRRSPAEG